MGCYGFILFVLIYLYIEIGLWVVWVVMFIYGEVESYVILFFCLCCVCGCFGDCGCDFGCICDDCYGGWGGEIFVV